MLPTLEHSPMPLNRAQLALLLVPLAMGCAHEVPSPAAAGGRYAAHIVDACWMTPAIAFFSLDGAMPASPRADQVLAATLRQIEQAGGRRLVEGHMDGAEARRDRNRQLDLCRAEYVRDWFLVRGVRQDAIWLGTRGDRRPLVPVPPGVSEPQNRYVVIQYDDRGRCGEELRRHSLD
jgi:outer membrane protein OmpA-like peptidoglycan-associated protein